MSLRSPIIRDFASCIFCWSASGVACRNADNALLAIGAEVLARLNPQFLQNLASAVLGVLQFGQARTSGCPQFWQYLASCEFSKEQFGHFIFVRILDLLS